MKVEQKKLEKWHASANMVFMKLRISIIALGISFLVNAGCSTVKTAYNGDEQSRFTNPAKIAEAKNPNGLEPVAEGPVMPETHTANTGGVGINSMTGSSEPESWGGSLSDR
ncbi:MAG TPA: hypothetical protein VHY22_02575 [Chthoniobacteraceae bacterium]|nr:hypothetical protein [Chthoniobacteraceae bacterium]